MWLSGFILTYTYIQPDDSLRGDRISFWRARFARVYPVYLFALLVSAPLFGKRLLSTALTPFETSGTVFGALLTPLLLQAWWPPAACEWNCAGWSLSVETLFYAIFPILGVWIAHRVLTRGVARAAVIWMLSLAFPILYIVFAPDGAEHVTEGAKFFWLSGLKYNPLVHVGEFVAGIACGLIFLRRAATGKMQPVPGWSVGSVTVLVCAIVASGLVPYPLLHSGVLAPLFAFVIYGLASRDVTERSTGLRSAVMVRLGECSYALYLLHPSIIEYCSIAARHMGLGGDIVYIVFTMSFVISILASTVVFDRVEEPARRWLRARTAGTARIPQPVPPVP